MAKNVRDNIRSSKNSSFKIFELQKIFIVCRNSQSFHEIDVDCTWQNLSLCTDTNDFTQVGGRGRGFTPF